MDDWWLRGKFKLDCVGDSACWLIEPGTPTSVDDQAPILLSNTLDTYWNTRHGGIGAWRSITWTGVALPGHRQAPQGLGRSFHWPQSRFQTSRFSQWISQNGFRTLRISLQSRTPSNRSHCFTRFTHTGGFAQDSCTFKKDFRSIRVCQSRSNFLKEEEKFVECLWTPWEGKYGLDRIGLSLMWKRKESLVWFTNLIIR